MLNLIHLRPPLVAALAAVSIGATVVGGCAGGATADALTRGGNMLVEVTQTPEGIALSVNGSPASPALWVEGWTFRQSSGTILSFRRSGEGGPATELRYMVPGAHLVLKRQ